MSSLGVGCITLRGPGCNGRDLDSDLANFCGAAKLFVAVAKISTVAFRFSAIR